MPDPREARVDLVRSVLFLFCSVLLLSVPFRSVPFPSVPFLESPDEDRPANPSAARSR